MYLKLVEIGSCFAWVFRRCGRFEVFTFRFPNLLIADILFTVGACLIRNRMIFQSFDLSSCCCGGLWALAIRCDIFPTSDACNIIESFCHLLSRRCGWVWAFTSLLENRLMADLLISAHHAYTRRDRRWTRPPLRRENHSRLPIWKPSDARFMVSSYMWKVYI